MRPRGASISWPCSFPALSYSGLAFSACSQSHLSKGCCSKGFNNTARLPSTPRWLPGPLGSLGLGLWVTSSWKSGPGRAGSHSRCSYPALPCPQLHCLGSIQILCTLAWSGHGGDSQDSALHLQSHPFRRAAALNVKSH